MEGEEESSFDVTGDDIDLGFEERPVSRYGSPIALPESTDHEEALKRTRQELLTTM